MTVFGGVQCVKIKYWLDIDGDPDNVMLGLGFGLGGGLCCLSAFC